MNPETVFKSFIDNILTMHVCYLYPIIELLRLVNKQTARLLRIKLIETYEFIRLNNDYYVFSGIHRWHPKQPFSKQEMLPYAPWLRYANQCGICGAHVQRTHTCAECKKEYCNVNSSDEVRHYTCGEYDQLNDRNLCELCWVAHFGGDLEHEIALKTNTIVLLQPQGKCKECNKYIDYASELCYDCNSDQYSSDDSQCRYCGRC